jgi:hypothetical protein
MHCDSYISRMIKSSRKQEIYIWHIQLYLEYCDIRTEYTTIHIGQHIQKVDKANKNCTLQIQICCDLYTAILALLWPGYLPWMTNLAALGAWCGRGRELMRGLGWEQRWVIELVSQDMGLPVNGIVLMALMLRVVTGEKMWRWYDVGRHHATDVPSVV